MAFERNLEGASIQRLVSVSPPLPHMESVLNKKHPWETLQWKTALTHPPSWEIIYLRPPFLTHLCLYPQSNLLFTFIDSTTCINLHKHLTGQRAKPLWAIGNEEDPACPQLKGPLSQLREGEAEGRAEVRHTSRAKTVQCTKAHEHYFMHVLVPSSADGLCTCPQPITALATAVQAWAYCQCSRTPPPTPAATAPHCLPLTSFQSHIWLVCCLPCLNILSHQSSASVLFVILKWTSVWQQ